MEDKTIQKALKELRFLSRGYSYLLDCNRPETRYQDIKDALDVAIEVLEEKGGKDREFEIEEKRAE